MANPMDVMKGALQGQKSTYSTETHAKEKSHIPEYNNPDTMKELISRVFNTRNLLHFEHWRTKSFAAHGAVGELYDGIIDEIDNIVEVYQGKHGLLEGLSTTGSAMPDDIIDHVKTEAKWVEDNRSNIAGECPPIENLIDGLSAAYLKTIYKLENLH